MTHGNFTLKASSIRSSSFKFCLQQQKLIELIREKNVELALEYAQSHLAERVEENPEVLSELERTLALLAFEEPETSPFGELLHPSQRQKVIIITSSNYWSQKCIYSLTFYDFI